MSVDTQGRLLGFIDYEDILSYIKKKYDPNPTCTIKKNEYGPINFLPSYKINPHSIDDENEYIISGFINFDDHGDCRNLFYYYSNINALENLEYYTDYGLDDMVEAETTCISLGKWGNSIEIMEDLLHAFDGGWLDEDDCDDNQYYFVPSKRWIEGGIYKRKNEDSYFIVTEVEKTITSYEVVKNVQDGLSVSRKMILESLAWQLKSPLKKENFSFLDPEKMREITDGYLGCISDEERKSLKKQCQS